MYCIFFRDLNVDLIEMGHRPVEHSFDIWHLIKVFFVDVYSSIYRSIWYVLLAPLTIEIQVVSFFADVSTVGAGVLDVYSIFVDLLAIWIRFGSKL